MGLLPVLCIDFYQDIGEHDIEQSPGIRINPTWALLQAPALSSLSVILDAISVPVDLLGHIRFVNTTLPSSPVRPACMISSLKMHVEAFTNQSQLLARRCLEHVSSILTTREISVSLRLQSEATQDIQVVLLWTSCTLPYRDIYDICRVWSG